MTCSLSLTFKHSLSSLFLSLPLSCTQHSKDHLLVLTYTHWHSHNHSLTHIAHTQAQALSSLKCLTVFIDFQFLNSVKFHRYLVRQTFIYIGQSKITCLMHFFLQVQSFLEKVTLGKEKFLNA